MDLAISETQQNVVTVAVCVLVGILAAIALLRFLIRRLVPSIVHDVPSPQMKIFEHRLRGFVFRDPALFMTRLSAPDHLAFVTSLWKESSWAVPKDKFPDAALAGDFEIHNLRLQDGRPIAIIRMPPSLESRDPVLFGIVLPHDPSFAQDLNRARKFVHFFVLYGPGYGRDSDLCEWSVKGRQLTYNIGAPKDPEGFARAVGDKLAELRR
jgi:hypothetical protein